MPDDLIIDSFAGGGGASLGIEWALGRGPDVAINHNSAAIEMHRSNHPDTHHYSEDVFRVNPQKATGGKPVGLLWASPDCRHFSRAKGGKPVQKSIRGLAWVVIKWADAVRPRVIVLENVREFQDWGPLCPRWDCAACKWRGTQGQAALGRRGRRACPRCEGAVTETAHQVPDPDRRGVTFRQFCGRLRGLGYHVEHRVLNAADFGAPTHRRRLFLVARCDGLPIQWPEPTHGDPAKIGRDLFSADQLPWRTAAECIDFSIPCPSIFDRKKPLAEKTLKRIAHGVKRYVLDNPRPFLVRTDMHRSNSGCVFDAAAPLNTVTSTGGFAVVNPLLAHLTHGGERRAHPADEPTPTVTGANRGELGLIAPVVANLAHGDSADGRDRGLRANAPDAPLGTVHAGGGSYAVVAPYLYPRYGEKDGSQAPRTASVEAPMPTVVQTGNGAMLCAAFIAKHFGGMVGVKADVPLPTTTARGTQNQLAAVNLVHMNHGEKQWNAADEPLRTVTTGGHAALVASFMVRYFGKSVATPLDRPLPTACAEIKDGLVTVSIAGEPYVIVDIGMRMLKPRELARAQGFPDSYKLTGTATSQVERIGNSVCPHVAAALVRANCPELARKAVAA